MTAFDEESAQRQRFSRFCFWLAVAGFSLGISQTLIGVLTGSTAVSYGSPLAVVCGAAGLWARSYARRHPLAATARLLCGMLLALLVGASLIIPPVWPMFLVATLMVVIVALPYVVDGLRRLLLIAFGAGTAIVVIGHFAGIPSGLVAPPPWVFTSLNISGCLMGFGLSLFLLWQFNDRLQEIIGQIRGANATLTGERTQLEVQVAVRTAELTSALQTAGQRETELASALDMIRANQQTLRAVSAPIIPVLPGVIIAPLIGEIDQSRAMTITEHVLHAVVSERARYVIVDITGVPLVDTSIAQALVQLTTAVQLLGASVFLVGIRPEVAQTIVSLGVELGAARTYANLREAIRALLAPPTSPSSAPAGAAPPSAA